tara:strand:- start:352 stop:531 length:180 start_codon:yes stop_codon:yes gene_type:complete
LVVAEVVEKVLLMHLQLVVLVVVVLVQEMVRQVLLIKDLLVVSGQVIQMEEAEAVVLVQ